MMRDKTNKLLFQSDRMKRNKNKTRFIIAFLCFSLLLGAISFLMLLRSYDYDLGSIVRTTESSGDSSVLSSESTTEAPTGSAVFLFAHTSDDGKTIRSICCIAADMGAKSVAVLPLSPQASVTLDGKKTTLKQAFLEGGAEELRVAAAADTGITADRYIVLTDTGFINCLKTLGDLKITLPEAVRCKTENLVLELPAGEQLLAPDTALRLIKYNLSAYSSEKAAKQNAALLTAAVQTYFVPELASRSEEVFSELINYVRSDISAVDFAAAKSAADAFALSEDKGTIAVVDSLPVVSETASAEESAS